MERVLKSCTKLKLQKQAWLSQLNRFDDKDENYEFFKVTLSKFQKLYYRVLYMDNATMKLDQLKMKTT